MKSPNLLQATIFACFYFVQLNEIETTHFLLQEVCKDVTIEPPLIPSKELGDKSCLDVGARGLWSGLEKTLCDVRIFHPGAKSYKNKNLDDVFKSHEKQKKDKYLNHVLNKEKCSFTPFSLLNTQWKRT